MELDEPGGLRAGIRQAINALLLSPKFLFRFELDSAPESPYPAEKSLLVWQLSCGVLCPDEALLDAAEAGELDTEEGLRSTAQEMLNDERSVGMRQDLSSQWFIQDQTRYADPEYSLFQTSTKNYGRRCSKKQNSSLKRFGEKMPRYSICRCSVHFRE